MAEQFPESDVFIASAFRMSDITQQPRPEPCPDCGRTYVNSENVTWTAPDPNGGLRTIWSGCCDCWLIRSHPERLAGLVAALWEADENIRQKMLAAPTTDDRDTYGDGYGQGLATAIGALRDVLLPDFPPTPADVVVPPGQERDQ